MVLLSESWESWCTSGSKVGITCWCLVDAMRRSLFSRVVLLQVVALREYLAGDSGLIDLAEFIEEWEGSEAALAYWVYVIE